MPDPTEPPALPAAQPGLATIGPVSFAIFALARAHRAFAAELLRDLGLYPGQELLLMQLLERDHQTQSELLDAVGLDHSTVSRSLRRMQEAGLLTREPTESDRRILRVSLTDRGRALREPLGEMWTTLERLTVSDLEADSPQRFVEGATRIRRAIENRPHQPGAEGT